MSRNVTVVMETEVWKKGDVSREASYLSALYFIDPPHVLFLVLLQAFVLPMESVFGWIETPGAILAANLLTTTSLFTVVVVTGQLETSQY